MVNLVDNMIEQFGNNNKKYVTLRPNCLSNHSNHDIDIVDTNGYCKDSEFLFVDYEKSTYETLVIKNKSTNINNNVCCLAAISCYAMNVTVLYMIMIMTSQRDHRDT